MHTIIHILGRAQGKSRRVNAYRASLLCVREPRPHRKRAPRHERDALAGRLDGPGRAFEVPFVVPFRLPFRLGAPRLPSHATAANNVIIVFMRRETLIFTISTGCINTTTQDRSVDERARYSSPGAASGEARRNWANWVRQHGAPARAGTRAPR